MAVVRSKTNRKAWLNTGAELKTVWLNGEKLYESKGWTGWHPGKERIRIKLRKGDNRIVIESGRAFSINITDKRIW